jgi:hypothetical protein
LEAKIIQIQYLYPIIKIKIKVLIKASLGEDTRVSTVPIHIPYAELKQGLEMKFTKQNLKLTYMVPNFLGIAN